ncbi:SprT family protein [Salisediminibacterium selenitireducens]|uniref:Protein SprT-like n=1 Tax=Bacillus selenitireducens (strain ATCC 700615 / DSM 15326 / MLS10) TaxID=439292 RepID=D6XY05_BACIE|nr:SprT family protein [Salisediminibacterium selenitireducens]ADH98078.1 protein of unknown function DUF335 SprT [[Bacillus] selenitireducens MLS10]
MTENELQRLTEQLSAEFFGKPFRHRITFNKRLRTTGGRYLLKSHHIEINPGHYETFGKNELIGIIKHELCHYHLHIEGRGYRHQDAEFKRLLKETGASRHCRLIPGARLRSTKLHIYHCGACRQVYERKRRMDVKKFACGRCGGKLKFIKTLSAETIDGI